MIYFLYTSLQKLLILHFLIASDTGTQAVPKLKQFGNIPYFRSIKDILETIGTFTYLHKIMGYMDIQEYFPEMKINQ